MYTPPNGDAIPWELDTDDFPPSKPSASEEPNHTEGWRLAGRPAAAAPPAARPRKRTPLATFGPFVLLLGPGALYSVLVTGYILGLLGSGPLVYVKERQGVWQGFTACAAVLIVAASALRQHDARTGEWPARIPAWLLYPLCVVLATADAGYTMYAATAGSLNGYTEWQYILAGGAALWWFLLLHPAAEVFAREPGRTHAPRARRALLVCMLGYAAATPVVAQATFNNFLGHASVGMVERMVAIYNGGWAAAANPGRFPALAGLRSVVVMLVSNASNAAIEEVAFALIVLALANRGWNRWAVTTAAAVLRAVMHLYYGPPGIGMAAFSALNAALLRWRRLWPLIAAHTAYDEIQWWADRTGHLPQVGSWANIAVLGALCCAVVVLAALADAAVRRLSRSPASAGAAA